MVLAGADFARCLRSQLNCGRAADHTTTRQDRSGRRGHTSGHPIRHSRTDMSVAGAAGLAGTIRHHRRVVFRPVDRHGRPSSARLSDQAVALVVKRYAGRVGLSANSFAGHSLRAGFVTSAARAGEPERRIMRTTGHKSVEMVLRYVRQANVFSDNAALALGL